jgi:hypothetical protein
MFGRKAALMLGIFMIGMMALAIPTAVAEDPVGSIDATNSVTFSTGALTGRFEGTVPHLTFYATNDIGRSEYQVNFRALIEFSMNSSGDGEYQSPQLVGRADFDSGTWVPSNFYPVKDTSGTVIGMGFNFTLNSPIQIEERSGQPSSLNAGDVVLRVLAYNSTRTIQVNGKSVTVNTAEMKIDFILQNWPFVSSNDKIALQINLHSAFNRFDLNEASGTETVDANNGEEAQVLEHNFQETTGPEQDIHFASGTVTTSRNIGFFRFVDTATVTPSGGTPYSVPVRASFKGEREDGESFFKLYLAYPYFPAGATLVHDPSVGLSGGFPTLFAIAGGAAVAGLVAVVVIRHRHVEVQKDSVHN